MPYILQHQATKQIYTCLQVNHYQLSYYGVKYWDSYEATTEEAGPFLHSRGEQDPGAWMVKEMEERELKLCNVRLKNDPGLKLFENAQGKPEAVKSPES